MEFIKKSIILLFALLLSGCSYFMVVSFRIYEYELNYSSELLDSACLLFLKKYSEYKIPDSCIIHSINKYPNDKGYRDKMQTYMKEGLYYPFAPQSNNRCYMYRALDTALIYMFEVSGSDNRNRLSLHWIEKDSIDARPIFYEELNKKQRTDVNLFFEKEIVPKIEGILTEIK